MFITTAYGTDALAETNASDTNPTIYIFFGGKRIARLDPGTTTPKYYVGLWCK
jgi:hypothetical protein